MNEASRRGAADEVFEKACLTVAHDEANVFEAVVPPIAQASLFTFESVAEMAATQVESRMRFLIFDVLRVN